MKSTVWLFILAVFFTSFNLFGESVPQQYTIISGELTGILTSEKPYLVIGDIYVTPGSTVTLEAGTILLFNNFAGLHIQGTLYVKGTPENPVVFTSKNDSSVNSSSTVAPAPFDWNGIDVYENTVGSEFTCCIIRYSVYGIRSQTEYVKILNSTFLNNGKSDFTVKEAFKEIEPGIPFSYNYETVYQSPSVSDPEIKNNAQQKAPSVRAKVMRYAGTILFAGCGVYAGITYFTKYKPAQKRLKELSELDESEMLSNSSIDWVEAKEERNKWFTCSVAASGGALLGLLAFSISFAF
jgi:hypothetical protein